MPKYSKKFRERMVKRMLGPHAMTASQLSQRVGICQTTLSRWRRDSVDDMASAKTNLHDRAKARSTTKRSPLECMQLVVEAAQRNDGELGVFLRQHGIHESELRRWRAQLEEALSSPSPRTPSHARDKKRIRSLERELMKKDKALAEAAALLVLQKKVRRIWEGEADNTDERNGR